MRNIVLKNRTIVLVFVLMCLIGLIAPLVTLATGYFESHITYSSDCGGISVEGQLEQYGKKGTKASTITLKVKPYFRFISWNDGSVDLQRNDVFDKGDKNYIAFGKLDLDDLDVFQFKCSTKDVTYSLTKKDFSFYESQDDTPENKSVAIRALPNFENIKMQSTKDFYIESSNILFSESKSKKWICFSMRNDKTKIHNLLAYYLLNNISKNTEKRYFKFVNVVFEDSYSGIYLLIENNDDYYKRCFNKKIDWEITINNLPSPASHDYHNTYSYDVIVNNTNSSSEKIAKQLESFLKNESGWSDSSIDKESLINYLSINQVLKNNAGTSNDLRIFKFNGKYYFDPYISYSLSSPLYRWFNWEPNGNVSYNNFINSISSSNLFTDSELQSCIKQLNNNLTNSIENAINYIGLHSDSVKADNTIVIPTIDDYFGMPDELKSLTSQELLSYYLEWLNDRSGWLSTIYL